MRGQRGGLIEQLLRRAEVAGIRLRMRLHHQRRGHMRQAGLRRAVARIDLQHLLIKIQRTGPGRRGDMPRGDQVGGRGQLLLHHLPRGARAAGELGLQRGQVGLRGHQRGDLLHLLARAVEVAAGQRLTRLPGQRRADLIQSMPRDRIAGVGPQHLQIPTRRAVGAGEATRREGLLRLRDQVGQPHPLRALLRQLLLQRGQLDATTQQRVSLFQGDIGGVQAMLGQRRLRAHQLGLPHCLQTRLRATVVAAHARGLLVELARAGRMPVAKVALRQRAITLIQHMIELRAGQQSREPGAVLRNQQQPQQQQDRQQQPAQPRCAGCGRAWRRARRGAARLARLGAKMRQAIRCRRRAPGRIRRT